jgi:hypothetical protein
VLFFRARALFRDFYPTRQNNGRLLVSNESNHE